MQQRNLGLTDDGFIQGFEAENQRVQDSAHDVGLCGSKGHANQTGRCCFIVYRRLKIKTHILTHAKSMNEGTIEKDPSNRVWF